MMMRMLNSTYARCYASLMGFTVVEELMKKREDVSLFLNRPYLTTTKLIEGKILFISEILI